MKVITDRQTIAFFAAAHGMSKICQIKGCYNFASVLLVFSDPGEDGKVYPICSMHYKEGKKQGITVWDFKEKETLKFKRSSEEEMVLHGKE